MLGFFILEDHVLNTGNGLITRAFLDEMWTMALSKIVTALQTNSVSLSFSFYFLIILDVLKCAEIVKYFRPIALTLL